MIYAPVENAGDWKKLLAEPEKQWKKGYSAYNIAQTWQNANGFPKSIIELFKGFKELTTIIPLLIIPEHKVALPGGTRPSQNDVWVLARNKVDLFSITVEGKVDETFGPTVDQWRKNSSDGKKKRLHYLCDVLEIKQPCKGTIRYQLMHRTASAIIEAKRFNAKKAIMLVHSFSDTIKWFEDYKVFADQLEVNGKAGKLTHVGLRDGIDLYIGWVNESP